MPQGHPLRAGHIPLRRWEETLSGLKDITRDFNDRPAPEGIPDLRDFDIVQRTCALEVVLVLRGIEDHRMIDRLRNTAPIPLDAQPGGTMLACMPSPAEPVERPE